MGDTKTAAYQSAVSKELFQPSRFCVGGNVEIDNRSAEEKVTHTTATEISEVVAPMEAVEDLDYLLAHLLAGYGMLVASDNVRLHESGLFPARVHPLYVILLGKSRKWADGVHVSENGLTRRHDWVTKTDPVPAR
jgi:hypothetical protein